MTRLLILSFSDISSDARVLKQVRHFADRYDVTTLGYGTSPDPRVNHVRLDDSVGIRRWRRIDLIARRFRTVYWSQPAVTAALHELSSHERFDVVLANDIDTIGLALSLEPTRGVHADIHEYAPRQNEEVLVWRVFIAPYVRWMCANFLHRAASITTVGRGIADEYRRRYSVDSEVVTNAAPYHELTPTEVGDPIRLVHSGASIRNRRIESLIQAAIATRTNVLLDLYLMGNDPDYIAELRERAASSQRVRILEPVPYEQLVRRLNEYDVGLHVIAPTNFNNRWALPNKFFDYIQARLGIVIGPTAEMQRILEEHGLGAVADGFEDGPLTTVFDSLTQERVREWKMNAHTAARELSSDEQVKTWERAVSQIAEGRV